jgi:metallo-beta-lactamase family protein
MHLSFIGAALEVTGSCYLIDTGDVRFLVDCGMYQGGADARSRNARPFPFPPASIDFVLLTHAHIDHSGLLPKLVREGFKGPIYATAATADLLDIMLRDSAHLQEMAAERQNRGDNGNNNDISPIYTMADADACLTHVEPLSYDQDLHPHPSVHARFRDAGHILGSAIIEVWVNEGRRRKKLVFSGDLGQPGRPILRNPTIIKDADVLIVESTYGNRAHKDLAATLDELVYAIDTTLHEKKGNVIIPAFAVGRTQELLYFLRILADQDRLRGLEVYVDSPMATQVTETTVRHLDLFDEEARRLISRPTPPRHKLSLRFVGSVAESMALNEVRSGAVIISASGMCDGGRIKHHLRHNLGRPENTILITGFQAQGTLGRRLVDGAKSVRIFGEEIVVRAQIYTLGGLSAHADQSALLDWLRGFTHPPRQTFVTHGEASIATEFAVLITEQLGWEASTPAAGDEVFL